MENWTLGGINAFLVFVITFAGTLTGVYMLIKKVLNKIRFSDESFVVNSYHHQSVKDLADGYETFACSDDGLIEAIYMPSRRFVAGVQWHPEKRFEGDGDSFRILIDFVDSCKK